jgi:hypothetical protein
MKTESFEKLIANNDYEAPMLIKIDGKNVYQDVEIIKIVEINVSDSINGQKLDLPNDRGYKLYWTNPEGKIKYWACKLGSDSYEKFVMPNLDKINK